MNTSAIGHDIDDSNDEVNFKFKRANKVKSARFFLFLTHFFASLHEMTITEVLWRTKTNGA